MNVSLTPELEELVSNKVATGLYQTASEVVRDALRLLRERDEHKLALLRQDLRHAMQEVSHGRYADYDGPSVRNLARRVKARGRRRLAGTRSLGGQ
jgi:antitoxin ParD1/3/4